MYIYFLLRCFISVCLFFFSRSERLVQESVFGVSVRGCQSISGVVKRKTKKQKN